MTIATPPLRPDESPQPFEAQLSALRQEAKQLRATQQQKAFWFLGTLMIGFLLTALAYIWAHRVVPVSVTKWPPTDLVDLDPLGRVRRIGERDLEWYIGRDATAKLSAELRLRSERIEDLHNRVVRQALLEFQVRFPGNGLSSTARDRVNQLGIAARAGEYDKAATLFTSIVQGWSDETRKTVGEKSIFDLNYGLGELAHLKHAQFSSLGLSLEPPLMHQIFWMSPRGALAESVWWSVLGTFVNLLLNVSQARALGRFRPDEVWVSLAKLVYGPALSFVLILVLYFGVLDAGTETRFWFLPLAGFLFGYNVRKIAAVIDQLSSKLLGNASASVNRIGAAEARAADHAAAAVRAEAQPKSLAELKQLAPLVAHTATVAAVIKQQNES